MRFANLASSPGWRRHTPERRLRRAFAEHAAPAILVVTLALGGCSNDAPSDDALRQTFISNRETFDALRAQLCRLRYDLTISRDPAWTQPQISPAEQRLYLDELDALGARSVKYLRGCQLWIDMWSAGIRRDAAQKKYRFGPPLYRIIEVKEPPTKDLNFYLGRRVPIASFEKNIEGDWWIELDHWR